MRILFLVPSYHTMNFFKPIIKKLVSRGAQIRVLAIYELPTGAKEDKLDTYRVDWGAFDWHYIETWKPDRIIIFNGYFRKIHAATLILQKRYPTLLAEVAWFPQNDYIYMDINIHHRSQISKTEVDCRTPLTEKHKKLLEDLRARYKYTGTEPKDLPEKFILIPMQLERDTSILYASDFFKDMNSLIGYVRRNSTVIPMVVKTHPKAHTDELEEKMKLDGVDIVVSDPKVTMNDLTHKATMLVGINSTSLIEALIHYKPVLQFGNNVAHHKNRGACLDFDYYNRLVHPINQAFYDVNDGVPRWGGKEYIDRVLLHLMANQIPFRDPPDWVVNKIWNFDTSCRTMKDL